MRERAEPEALSCSHFGRDSSGFPLLPGLRLPRSPWYYTCYWARARGEAEQAEQLRVARVSAEPFETDTATESALDEADRDQPQS